MIQDIYSLGGRASYRKISRSRKAALLYYVLTVSLWTVTRISTALLPRCLSNFGAIVSVLTRISQLREFTRSCGETSVCLVNKGPVSTQKLCTIAKLGSTTDKNLACYIYQTKDINRQWQDWGQLELRWVPTKKFGEIKRMCVWFHSHKVCWVNPAQFCSYKASNVIGCYPKVSLKIIFYFYSSSLKWHPKRSKILSTEKQPITHD